MLNKRLRFYVRITPDERDGRECLEVDGGKILWVTNEKYTGMKKLPRLKFETDGIFTDACQATIYETIVGQDLFSGTTKMVDVVVMAFGQSGTGKSYTMTGIRDHYHFRGVLPRLFETIFELWKKDFTLEMSAVEFLHGKCHDLLTQSAPEIDCRKVTGVRLNGECEANELLFIAESNRCRISRGNCGSMVVTLYVKPAQHGVRNPVLQKIHFIDTAGTEVHWSKLRESPCLTKTTGWSKEIFVFDPTNDWAFLTERSIKGRLDTRQAYRNSMMVGYICDSLQKGNIRLIGHIRRSSSDLRYTLATLRFGCGLTGRPEKLGEVTAKAKVNVTEQSLQGNTKGPAIGPMMKMVTDFFLSIRQPLLEQKEVQCLRDELALTDLLESNFVPLTSSSYAGDSLTVEVENYLSSPENETCANLLTMAHPFTLLGTCRAVYKKSMDKLNDMYNFEGGSADKGSVMTGGTTMSSPRGSKKNLEIHGEMIAKLVDRTSSVNSRLDQSIAKQEEAKQSAVPHEMLDMGRGNRKPLWKEFLSRYPHWHMKLAAVGEDLRQAREEHDKVEEQVKDLMNRMQENKFEVERTTWERNNEMGNPVRPDGQLVLSEEEQAAQTEQMALLQAHKTTTETFKQVHNFYKQVAQRFNEAHEEADQLFTEYVNTTYWNILVLPATEDYEETVPILGVDCSIKPSQTESEENFIELQNKYLNQDRRGPHPPRWP